MILSDYLIYSYGKKAVNEYSFLANNRCSFLLENSNTSRWCNRFVMYAKRISLIRFKD